MTDLLGVVRERGVARIRLNRPDRRNALDEALIEALRSAFESIARDRSIATIILSGEGRSLCAGADIDGMRKAAAYGRDENIADLMPLGRMLRALDAMPQTTIARVHGPVHGGGIGLVAACDIAIGSAEASFCLSEIRLGIVPGMISPYVLRAIGTRAARRYFQTAEIFDAREAERIGLLHEVVAAEALDERIDRLSGQIAGAAPGARAIAKTVARDIADRPIDDARIAGIAAMIADLRAGPEAREGLSAFLEKRRPSWQRQP
ncbi:MAG TPA: enoyl-CoA hydratase-related protein [Roseomonas sp.]|jgi:methylglutaconyl-CoA hydratase